MSSNTNSVKVISLKELKSIQESGQRFFLYFKGADNCPRSEGGMWNCNYLCEKCPLVKCYAILWREYNAHHDRTESCRTYNLVSFKGFEEIDFRVASLEYGDLEGFFNRAQRECEIEQRNLQQSLQRLQSHKSATSDNTEISESQLCRASLSNNPVPRSSPSQRLMTQIPPQEHSHSNVHIPPPLQPPLSSPDDIIPCGYDGTYCNKLKRDANFLKSSRTGPYPAKGPPSPKHCTSQPISVICGNPNIISKPRRPRPPSSPKSPLPEISTVSQLLESSSVIQRGQQITRPRRASSPVRSLTQTLPGNILHQLTRTSRSSTTRHTATITHSQSYSHIIASPIRSILSGRSYYSISQPIHPQPQQTIQYHPRIMGVHHQQQTSSRSYTPPNRGSTQSSSHSRGSTAHHNPPNH